jgi:hypothetical protein
MIETADESYPPTYDVNPIGRATGQLCGEMMVQTSKSSKPGWQSAMDHQIIAIDIAAPDYYVP